MIRTLPFALILLAPFVRGEDPPPPDQNPVVPPLGGAPILNPVPASVVAASAIPAAPATEANRWTGSVALVGGWDNNVLLQPANRPSATDESSAVLGGELRLAWHPISTSIGRVDVSADGDQTSYPSAHEADLSRAGLRAFGQLTLVTDSLGRIDPGLLIAAHRYWLDGDGAASSLMATAIVTKVRPWWVGVVTVGWVGLDYDDNTAASGSLLEVSYRHLFLLRESDSRRNLEVSLRGGGYLAEGDADTYRTVTGALAGAWRFGERQIEAGTIDVTLRLSFELRTYDHPDSSSQEESQSILRAGGQAAWWLWRTASLGPYVVFSNRDSTVDISDYQRFQTGLRFETTF